MAGASIGVGLGWKGPVAEAFDFNIPLEKPLSQGSYQLFVKNFYVGKMEATLGDTTLPLSIRRYDWTPRVTFETDVPVDKIVLRLFPNTFVPESGEQQEQAYIVQGV